MVFCLAAEPPAFWMSHCRFALAQSAFSASGSAETQRLEDWVSGRMIPTLAPLPSTVPEDDALALELVLAPPAGAVVFAVLFLSEEHPARASEAAAPTMTKPIALLRMGNSAFRVRGRRCAAVSEPRRPQ